MCVAMWQLVYDVSTVQSTLALRLPKVGASWPRDSMATVTGWRARNYYPKV
jgi:hypothetical protein